MQEEDIDNLVRVLPRFLANLSSFENWDRPPPEEDPAVSECIPDKTKKRNPLPSGLLERQKRQGPRSSDKKFSNSSETAALRRSGTKISQALAYQGESFHRRRARL